MAIDDIKSVLKRAKKPTANKGKVPRSSDKDDVSSDLFWKSKNKQGKNKD